MRSRHWIAVLALPALVLLYILARPTFTDPAEIFGLLHFVTSPDEADRVITTSSNELGAIDPDSPVELAWYALGSISKAPQRGWEDRLETLHTQHPLVVFSKSYCPYSKRAKRLLKAYGVSPAPTIIEVDLRPDGPHIKTLLIRLTRQSTFPNVILHGRSLGGSDDLVRLHDEDKLEEILEEAGLHVEWSDISF